MSSSSLLMVLMWVTCGWDSLGTLGGTRTLPCASVSPSVTAALHPPGGAFPGGGNCTPAPGGHPTLAWDAGILTEKTLSGWPLALMFVSWTCFSTIQASSCFPFCEGRDRSPWDTPNLDPDNPISDPCLASTTHLGPATHLGIPPPSSSPLQGPSIPLGSLAGAHHPLGGSCPVPHLSKTHLGLPVQSSPPPGGPCLGCSISTPTWGSLSGGPHTTLHSRSLIHFRFPPGHSHAPWTPTSR